MSDVEPAFTPLQRQPSHLAAQKLSLSHIAAGSCAHVYVLLQLSATVLQLTSVCYYCIDFDIFSSDSLRSCGALGAVSGRFESS